MRVINYRVVVVLAPSAHQTPRNLLCCQFYSLPWHWTRFKAPLDDVVFPIVYLELSDGKRRGERPPLPLQGLYCNDRPRAIPSLTHSFGHFFYNTSTPFSLSYIMGASIQAIRGGTPQLLLFFPLSFFHRVIFNSKTRQSKVATFLLQSKRELMKHGELFPLRTVHR